MKFLYILLVASVVLAAAQAAAVAIGLAIALGLLVALFTAPKETLTCAAILATLGAFAGAPLPFLATAAILAIAKTIQAQAAATKARSEQTERLSTASEKDQIDACS